MGPFQCVIFDCPRGKFNSARDVVSFHRSIHLTTQAASPSAMEMGVVHGELILSDPIGTDPTQHNRAQTDTQPIHFFLQIFGSNCHFVCLVWQFCVACTSFSSGVCNVAVQFYGHATRMIFGFAEKMLISARHQEQCYQFMIQDGSLVLPPFQACTQLLCGEMVVLSQFPLD